MQARIGASAKKLPLRRGYLPPELFGQLEQRAVCDLCGRQQRAGLPPGPNNAAGEVLTDFAVTMPENTAYFRVAANLEIQPESYAVAQYTTRIAAKAPVLTVAAVRTLLDILRAGTYTQSQQSAIQNLENALLIID